MDPLQRKPVPLLIMFSMTTRRSKRLWAAVFLAASASLVGTSAALPALDRDLYSTGTVIETEHDAGTCAVAHNHALCMAWVGSKFLSTVDHSVRPADSGVTLVATESPELLHSATGLRPTNSRAPPAL